MKNIIKGIVVVFTFGLVTQVKNARKNKISSYWFKTGDYINKAFKVESSK